MKYTPVFRFLTIFVILFGIIPIGIFYSIAIRTKLPGMRGGPQDAFRHTFASSVVSKLISPQAVVFVTYICERDDSSPLDQMDRHNNYIGKKIGEESQSLFDLYSNVMAAVQSGGVDAIGPNQITWLPEKEWSLGL